MMLLYPIFMLYVTLLYPIFLLHMTFTVPHIPLVYDITVPHVPLVYDIIRNNSLLSFFFGQWFRGFRRQHLDRI